MAAYSNPYPPGAEPPLPGGLPPSGYAEGLDAGERERLLLEHLPEVRYIARRIHERLPAQVLLEDLVQAGVMGLIDALHRYDPARHAQLGTYARFRIRGAILDSLRALDWSPRDLRRRGRELKETERRLGERLGREPSAPEICAELGLELEAYYRLTAALHALESDAGPADADGLSALDLAASPEPDPFEQCQRSEDRARLTQVIAELPERDQQLLSLYYFEELTMKEVGAVLGIGESRVSQIHTALLAKLRARLREPAPPSA
jgi:RNA polymerase sigma factor for flagellar operon FliA